MSRMQLVALFGLTGIFKLLLPVEIGAAEKVATVRVAPAAQGLLATEKLSGEGVWVDPAFQKRRKAADRVQVKVWFDEQLLGDGAAYSRRAKEFSSRHRRELQTAAVKTLKTLNDRSYEAAKNDIEKLIEDKKLTGLQRHWIINGFSCSIDSESLDALKSVPGVKKIFVFGQRRGRLPMAGGDAPAFKPVERPKFDPARYQHPWYTRYLQADRVWKAFGITGQGTLNVIHDFNFVFSDNVTASLYRNPLEIPANGKDDDGNGLVDDYHGYDFDRGTANLTRFQVPENVARPQGMHGYMCAAIVCGAGAQGKEYEFGIAPESTWAGLMGSLHLERAVQWAVEQRADTYSMSFSIPNLGEYRSHWRKIMEHGSLCGIYFVSGAGNFARSAQVPVQMRTPEDIPNVVFAAAGVQRNFSRTPFSSQGPVKWETEHYHDGIVQKPEVCAFNMGLPLLLRNGSVRPGGLNGNSFAGPMFCGSIALMLSADPDLLPWDLREVITSTATDVGGKGVDDQTGHGLINCYRAVKEVLRRKAVRDGGDPSPYEGREADDTLDLDALRKSLQETSLKVVRVQPGSQAAELKLQPGDVLASYYGERITSQLDMQRAKNKAVTEKAESIDLVIERDGKTIELKIAVGPLGVVPVVEFADPTFK